MAEPVTTAPQGFASDVGAYSSIAGTGAQAISSILGGLYASEVADYNARAVKANAQAGQQAANAEAQQADYAAEIAAQDAQLAGQAAQFREQQTRLLTARQLGQQRAVLGASGLLPTSGSPLQVLLDNAYQGEMQANLVKYQGALNVVAQQRRASLLSYQGALKRYEGGQGVVSAGYQAGLLESQGNEAILAGLLRGGAAITAGAARLGRARYPNLLDPASQQTGLEATF